MTAATSEVLRGPMDGLRVDSTEAIILIPAVCSGGIVDHVYLRQADGTYLYEGVKHGEEVPAP